MSWRCGWALVAVCCAATTALGRPTRTPAPRAGDHRCPAGTVPLVEPRNAGETLRSCVIPAREYRHAPQRSGPYELVAANGRLLLRGQWRNGQQDGLWRTWHANGVLRRETHYEHGAATSDASWDEAGRPLNRRDATGSTVWYANGKKRTESRSMPDGVIEISAWYENGRPAKRERTRNGRRDGMTVEWFEGGPKKSEAEYRKGKLVSWTGWSANGRALASDACVDDADCATGVRNECYQCLVPYEGITRWREARRLIAPPPPPTGCAKGVFPCPRPPPPPAIACRRGRCVLADGRAQPSVSARSCGGTRCRAHQYCIEMQTIGGEAPPPGRPARSSTRTYCADSLPGGRAGACQPPTRDRRVRCRVYAP